MNCCICYEEITLKTNALLVNYTNKLVCECEERMCNKCANKLSPKKCPTCRTEFENVMCLGVGCRVTPAIDTRDQVSKIILNLIHDHRGFLSNKVTVRVKIANKENKDHFQIEEFTKWLNTRVNNEIWRCDNTGRWTLFTLSDGTEVRVELLTRALNEDQFESHERITRKTCKNIDKELNKNIMIKVTI
jgi:hypothetical protein